MKKIKIKFLKDRGEFKKGNVIEVNEDIGLQLFSTGDPESVEEATSKDAVTPRKTLLDQAEKKRKALAAKLKAEAEKKLGN